MSDRRDSAVTAKDLTKNFGDFTAVDRVNFEVAVGEIFGFLGPNGAGKTTTIKILCGLLTPSAGSATVAGYDVSEEYELIRRNIGYMSQKFSIYMDLTVRENLDFFGGIYGLTGKEKRRRDEWVLHMADLTDKTDMMTGELPLGWKQRLALGCAILHTPPILFLDEPTSGVDPISRRRFWELIHDMADRGVTVFVTTHYMDEAGYCGRLALMADGKLIAMGTPGELKSEWMKYAILEVQADDLFGALEALEKEQVFEDTAVFGNLLHVVAEDPDEATRAVSEILEKRNITVHRIEEVTPSLEDVFVSLASKKPGDED